MFTPSSSSLVSFLLLLTHALASPQPKSSATLHVPLTRRAPKSIDDIFAKGKQLRAKYKFSNTTTSNERRGSTSGISIIDQDSDSSYTGSVSIGTPYVVLSFLKISKNLFSVHKLSRSFSTLVPRTCGWRTRIAGAALNRHPFLIQANRHLSSRLAALAQKQPSVMARVKFKAH